MAENRCCKESVREVFRSQIKELVKRLSAFGEESFFMSAKVDESGPNVSGSEKGLVYMQEYVGVQNGFIPFLQEAQVQSAGNRTASSISTAMGQKPITNNQKSRKTSIAISATKKFFTDKENEEIRQIREQDGSQIVPLNVLDARDSLDRSTETGGVNMDQTSSKAPKTCLQEPAEEPKRDSEGERNFDIVTVPNIDISNVTGDCQHNKSTQADNERNISKNFFKPKTVSDQRQDLGLDFEETTNNVSVEKVTKGLNADRKLGKENTDKTINVPDSRSVLYKNTCGTANDINSYANDDENTYLDYNESRFDAVEEKEILNGVETGCSADKQTETSSSKETKKNAKSAKSRSYQSENDGHAGKDVVNLMSEKQKSILESIKASSIKVGDKIQCSKCGALGRSECFKSHIINKHIGKKLFACSICDKRFSSFKRARRHLREYCRKKHTKNSERQKNKVNATQTTQSEHRTSARVFGISSNGASESLDNYESVSDIFAEDSSQECHIAVDESSQGNKLFAKGAEVPPLNRTFVSTRASSKEKNLSITEIPCNPIGSKECKTNTEFGVGRLERDLASQSSLVGVLDLNTLNARQFGDDTQHFRGAFSSNFDLDQHNCSGLDDEESIRNANAEKQFSTKNIDYCNEEVSEFNSDLEVDYSEYVEMRDEEILNVKTNKNAAKQRTKSPTNGRQVESRHVTAASEKGIVKSCKRKREEEEIRVSKMGTKSKSLNPLGKNTADNMLSNKTGVVNVMSDDQLRKVENIKASSKKIDEKYHQCGKCFIQTRSDCLKNHIIACHTGKKMFACRFCSKTFAYKSNAQKHMRMSCKKKLERDPVRQKVARGLNGHISDKQQAVMQHSDSGDTTSKQEFDIDSLSENEDSDAEIR